MAKIKANTINGLSKDSAAETFQIRSVSTSRFVRKIGELLPEEMNMIVNAISLVVEIPL